MDKSLDRFFTASPLWAIRPEHISALVLRVLHGGAPRVDAAAIAAARAKMMGKGANKIAIVPIMGVLGNDLYYADTTYQQIGDAAEKAAADPSVKRIVLAVDSPGGEVTGLPETAALLAQIGKAKPVSAMVEGDSASAAYWLTSQAQDITLAPSGEVGSVGVRMMHVDLSQLLSNTGIKVTELYSGNFKTEWSPFKPLSEGAMADMQKRLDATHQEFLNAVTAGRGVRASQEIREARFGEGRMMSAPDAMTHGMVDHLQSSREFYKAIAPAPEVDEMPMQHGLPRKALRDAIKKSVGGK